MTNSRDNHVLGRYIVVYGATGAGKTTLSRRLAAALGLTAIEMDALMHRPNWEPTPPDEFREKVRTALAAAPDGWVCDGNYSRVRDITLEHADTVIWLHLPWRISFGRLLVRTVSRAWSRELLWGTNRESWRQSFASRNSILWWSISHHRAHERSVRATLAGLPPHVRVHELHTPREVEALLATATPVARAG